MQMTIYIPLSREMEPKEEFITMKVLSRLTYTFSKQSHKIDCGHDNQTTLLIHSQPKSPCVETCLYHVIAWFTYKNSVASHILALTWRTIWKLYAALYFPS